MEYITSQETPPICTQIVLYTNKDTEIITEIQEKREVAIVTSYKKKTILTIVGVLTDTKNSFEKRIEVKINTIEEMKGDIISGLVTYKVITFLNKFITSQTKGTIELITENKNVKK